MKPLLTLSLLILLAFSFTACTPPPPKSKTDVCKIFREYPTWYWATLDTQRKWGVPISTQMAIIHQESRFDGNAKPPREMLLGIIPWFRPTSAKGYSQAVNSTWKIYKEETGNHFSFRNEFDSATDFLGWYLERAHKRTGVAKNNTYEMYLAYHEGIGGYSRGSYKKKAWLVNVAKKVQRQANTYHYQLVKCQKSLPKKPWYNFWS